MKLAARIELSGKDVTDLWGKVLVSITVKDEAGVKADTCEIVFDDRAGFTPPPIGAEIRVWLGYESFPHYMGRYCISDWTLAGPVRILTISCAAADLTSKIRSPRSQSFHDTTVKAIVGKIAGDNGLTAVVDRDVGAVAIEHIDQQGESDVSFLTRLAGRNGAIFKLGDGQVIFAAKGSRKTPGGKEKDPVTLKPADVSSWTARYSVRGEQKSVSATYMDAASGKQKTVMAGEGEPRHRDRRLYGSKAEAESAAKSTLGDLTRGQMSIDLDMPGNPKVYAEGLIKLDDFNGSVDGDFFAKSVTHSWSSRGYITTAELETAGFENE